MPFGLYLNILKTEKILQFWEQKILDVRGTSFLRKRLKSLSQKFIWREKTKRLRYHTSFLIVKMRKTLLFLVLSCLLPKSVVRQIRRSRRKRSIVVSRTVMHCFTLQSNVASNTRLWNDASRKVGERTYTRETWTWFKTWNRQLRVYA